MKAPPTTRQYKAALEKIEDLEREKAEAIKSGKISRDELLTIRKEIVKAAGEMGRFIAIIRAWLREGHLSEQGTIEAKALLYDFRAQFPDEEEQE